LLCLKISLCTVAVPTPKSTFIIDPTTIQLVHIKFLGSGGFGDVYQATFTIPGRDPSIVAAKELKKYESNKSLYKRELFFLSTLQHDGICKCLGGWFTTDAEKNIKPTIILEYLPHKFSDAVRDAKLKGPGGDIFITMHDVNRICIRLVEVLAWLSSSGNTLGIPVYHKDLKPDNIMLTAMLQPKLIDVGLSNKQQKRNAQTTKELGCEDVAGTPSYIVCLVPFASSHSLRHLRSIARAHTDTRMCLRSAWCCMSCCRVGVSTMSLLDFQETNARPRSPRL
jgi:serine/threonine protein kinase